MGKINKLDVSKKKTILRVVCMFLLIAIGLALLILIKTSILPNVDTFIFIVIGIFIIGISLGFIKYCLYKYHQTVK